MKRLGPLLPVLAILVTLLFYAIPAAANPSAPIDGPQQSTTGPTPPLAVLQHDRLKPVDGVQDVASEALLTVPAYLWRHGCGPTALGMVVGYYDSQGFSDLVPGSASSQTAAVSQVIASGGDDGSPYPPGSEQHFEDYATPVDDYTTGMLTDDALAKGRTPHASNSLADFMQTSFSERDNMYGWSWSNDIGPAWTGYVQFANPAYTPSYLEYRWIYGEMTWEVLTCRDRCRQADGFPGRYGRQRRHGSFRCRHRLPHQPQPAVRRLGHLERHKRALGELRRDGSRGALGNLGRLVIPALGRRAPRRICQAQPGGPGGQPACQPLPGLAKQPRRQQLRILPGYPRR